MTISAKVIEHSIAPHGGELVTWEIYAPERIHKEVIRHRAFSFSILSTRARRFTSMLRMVLEDPYIPVCWAKDCREMQPQILMTPTECEVAITHWLEMRDLVVERARALHELGVHKGDVTPLLATYLHFRAVMTATDIGINNFFALRMHRKAKVEFQILAKRMAVELRDSHPVERGFGTEKALVESWHLPYILPQERASGFEPFDLAQFSAARCARMSVVASNQGVPDIDKDRDLFCRLARGDNVEASPMEHQGFPHSQRHRRSGNFMGWIQFRKLIPNETQGDFDWRKRLEELGDRDYEL